MPTCCVRFEPPRALASLGISRAEEATFLFKNPTGHDTCSSFAMWDPLSRRRVLQSATLWHSRAGTYLRAVFAVRHLVSLDFTPLRQRQIDERSEGGSHARISRRR